MFSTETSTEAIAEMLGIERNMVYRMRKNGNITWLQADRFACRLGVHPAFIWGFTWVEEQPHSTRPQAKKRATVTPPTEEQP